MDEETRNRSNLGGAIDDENGLVRVDQNPLGEAIANPVLPGDAEEVDGDDNGDIEGELGDGDEEHGEEHGDEGDSDGEHDDGDDDNEDDGDSQQQEVDRMALSPHHRAWALAIKAAIEADPELDNLNDYSYVQLAIACHGNVELALEKARDMQGFREEYEVRDSLEDAKKTIWEYSNLFDEQVIIAFSYSKDEQCYIATMDLAAMDNKALQTDKAWRTNLAGVYYIKQAMVPDFFSMVNGIVIIHECDGFDFFGKFGGLNHVTRLSQELVGAQPVYHREVKWFHTGASTFLMPGERCDSSVLHN
jgi:hypothetical protein